METTLDRDAFFREYTSHEAIVKYTRATAGFGISYLLDHDYKAVTSKLWATCQKTHGKEESGCWNSVAEEG